MINSIKIELLKSKRTKSFPILFLMILIASVWQLFVFKSNFIHDDLRNISTLYNNQTVDCLLLPIMVSIFSSQIVSNEKKGQTFKLQRANGKIVTSIFHQKYILSLVTFIILFVLELGVRIAFAKINGISTSFILIIYFMLGQILTSLILTSIFLSLSLIIKKQGIVLALGFLFGFLAMVLSSKSQSIFSFWIPGIGSAYLAPFKYHILSKPSQNINFEYLPDPSILTRFLIYTIFSLIIYIFVYSLVKKKGDSLL